MDLEDLRTFVETADAGGVSLAARRLGVSKSIVSRRLQRVETDLGIQLLARTTRGAALTEAGAVFRDHAARMCAEMEVARESMSPVGDLRGRLRIAVPLSIGTTHLTPVLAEMARQHPKLQINAAYADRFVDIVGEGFDCAIRVGHLHDSSLLARRVAPLEGGLVASPDYLVKRKMPETQEELLTHEFLMQGTEVWHLCDGDKIVALNPHGRFKADNGVALSAAAVSGLGIAALPDILVGEHLASGNLVRVMPHYRFPDHCGIFVVRPPGPYVSRKIRELTELLIEHFG